MKFAAWISGLICILIGGACGPSVKPASRFDLRKVTAGEIAKLEAVLPPEPAPTESIPDLKELVRGFAVDRAHLQGRMRRQALEEVSAIGAPAVPILDALLDEKQREQGELISVIEVLGAIDTPSSADALAKRVDIDRVRDPAIRAQAAFHLSKLTADHVLPHLLAQLKYESDGETVIWIAAVLAKHKNYAGLDGLRVLAQSGASPEVRDRARAMLDACAAEAGFADAESLHAAWWSADSEHRVPRQDPSPRLRLESWKRIAALSEFDLRRVDDARFALSRSASWILEPLTAALHEQDAHTRVHVAQCLERMGARASGACAELVLALDEPHVAAASATALGAIQCPDALAALVECTRPKHDPELRNAAALALGKLALPAAIPALLELLAPNEAPDLRQAAAESLVALGHDRDAIGVLIECLTRSGADASSAETVLENWLTDRARRAEEPAASILERWRSLGAKATGGANPDGVLVRQRARSELVRAALADLLPTAR